MGETQSAKRGFFSGVGKLLKRFFMVVGFMMTVSIIIGFVAAGRLVEGGSPRQPLPSGMILTYTFKPGLAEIAGKPGLGQPLFRPVTTFQEVIEGLNRAVNDPRVKGFVAKLDDLGLAPAQIQELRDTMAKFRAANKYTAIFAEDVGGFASGMGDYYLASSFKQIWLQPVGAVSINGISAEVPFFKGVMDKIGVEANFSHKGAFKSAPESLTETGMSAPHREMMTGLIGDLSDQIVSGIAADRGMQPDMLKQLINYAPYTDAEALKFRLVDKLGYYNELLDDARHAAGDKDMKTVSLLRYASETQPSAGKPGFLDKWTHRKDEAVKPRIALIVGAGDIVANDSSAHVGLSGADMSADKIIKAFQAAQNDKSVIAVVFRVDSPGGSPGAAETIRRAIIETQQKGKPVIVSMGGYAASGGYWVATPADKIVAEPATITGSIGVFGGKFVLAQLWDKLGVHWDSVEAGDNARMWSSNVLFSDREKARFDFLLDNVYQAFVARVMEGRKLTREQVLAVAEGHVWTGRQAKERGLVDVLGGLDQAVALAKEAAHHKAEEDIPLKRFPGRKSLIQNIVEMAIEDSGVVPSLNISAADVLRELKAQMNSGTDVLRMPVWELR